MAAIKNHNITGNQPLYKFLYFKTFTDEATGMAALFGIMFGLWFASNNKNLLFWGLCDAREYQLGNTN